MKFLFDWCHMFGSDDNVKIGINWYKHHPRYKWKGITFTLYLIWWQFNLTYVNNYVAYKARFESRYTDNLKSLSARLAATKAKK